MCLTGEHDRSGCAERRLPSSEPGGDGLLRIALRRLRPSTGSPFIGFDSFTFSDLRLIVEFEVGALFVDSVIYSFASVRALDLRWSSIKFPFGRAGVGRLLFSVKVGTLLLVFRLTERRGTSCNINIIIPLN